MLQQAGNLRSAHDLLCAGCVLSFFRRFTCCCEHREPCLSPAFVSRPFPESSIAAVRTHVCVAGSRKPCNCSCANTNVCCRKAGNPGLAQRCMARTWMLSLLSIIQLLLQKQTRVCRSRKLASAAGRTLLQKHPSVCVAKTHVKLSRVQLLLLLLLLLTSALGQSCRFRRPSREITDEVEGLIAAKVSKARHVVGSVQGKGLARAYKDLSLSAATAAHRRKKYMSVAKLRVSPFCVKQQTGDVEPSRMG